MTDLVLNCDSLPIKNWEITPEGYMKLWIAIATANKDLIYENNDGTTRKEFISKENLLNKDSINSAIGKHLTHNHPPQAITSNNWREFSIGSALQEYAEDGDNLLIASMIYDQKIIDKIKSGQYKYVSAGYSAQKQAINQDGKIEQKQRVYNHFAILDENHEPRAGKTCSIRAFNIPNKDSKNSTNQQNNQNNNNSENQNLFGANNSNSSSSNSQPNNQTNSDAFNSGLNLGKELAKLNTQYSGILQENGKVFNWDARLNDIRRDILSCYYPEDKVQNISDVNLDGFWVSFELNKDILESQQVFSSPRNQQNDSGKSNRQKYIDMIEGRV